MRWPSFGPTPLAAVNALWSPPCTASTTRAGLSALRMASPTFGPTPVTAVSSRNMAWLSLSAKPNSATSFSVTFIWVYSVHSCPTAGSEPAVEEGIAAQKPTPAHSTTAMSAVFSTRVPCKLYIMPASVLSLFSI